MDLGPIIVKKKQMFAGLLTKKGKLPITKADGNMPGTAAPRKKLTTAKAIKLLVKTRPVPNITTKVRERYKQIFRPKLKPVKHVNYN